MVSKIAIKDILYYTSYTVYLLESQVKPDWINVWSGWLAELNECDLNLKTFVGLQVYEGFI